MILLSYRSQIEFDLFFKDKHSDNLKNPQKHIEMIVITSKSNSFPLLMVFTIFSKISAVISFWLLDFFHYEESFEVLEHILKNLVIELVMAMNFF